MPNIASVLKQEIARVAKKEAKGLVEPLRRQVAVLRHDNAEHKRQRAALDRRLADMLRVMRRAGLEETAPARGDGGVARRFSPAHLKAQRARLGLTAAEFGALVGCAKKSIYKWESGRVRPREAQLQLLAAVRGLSRREALARLARQKTRRVR